MMQRSCPRIPFLLLLWSITVGFYSPVSASTKNSIVNFLEEPIQLVARGDEWVTPFQETEIAVTIGATERYLHDGRSMDQIHFEKANQVHVIGPETLLVKCSTTDGTLDIVVKPKWSPRGAARFLDLIQNGYYNGCALNRVVKQFLTQFGISADYEKRTTWRSRTIKDDDASTKIQFQPGYMSFAGSGPNSRTTEVFVVMPDTPSHQLEYFGTNPWETPFGFVENLTTLEKWEASYGDMEPWGNGPNPQVIYQANGYEYLKEHFPKLSYIEECKIVSTSGESSSDKEEEL